jgi:D-xylose transport system permease protein
MAALPASTWRGLRASPIGGILPVLVALAAIWLFFGLRDPVFLSARNIYFLFMQSAVVATVALGITVVLLIGEIDLSAAAVAGVSAAAMAVLSVDLGWPAPLACLAALGIGTVIGVAQGAIIALVGIPSFVVTLAGLLGFQGVMLKTLGEQGAMNVMDPFVRGITTISLPPALGWIVAAACACIYGAALVVQRLGRIRRGLAVASAAATGGKLGVVLVLILGSAATLNAYRGVPLVVLILLAMTLVLDFLTKRTPFGRAIFAIGGNAESARRVGIAVPVIRIAAFGIVGLMAAVAGIFGASRYASVSFNAFAGGPLLLEAIGSAVIGGTSLFGGQGSVWNAILGALVIESLGNGLDLSGAGAADKLMVSGAILLLAVALDAVSRGNSPAKR